MLINHNLYLEDITTVASHNFPWNKIYGKSIVITGANGMIGSFLIDVIMYGNKFFDLNCTIFALVRNTDKAQQKFKHYDDFQLKIIHQDVFNPVNLEIFMNNEVACIIHAASNTHPVAYASDPIGTITTNLFGSYNMLEFSRNFKDSMFILLSSVEVYGQNRGDIDKFDEKYCGYIDCNTLRAGYPESKRASEALCQAFWKKYEQKFLIGRLARVYGPTLLPTDSKAMSQFIFNAVRGENIVLKSSGTQYFSYIYVADAVKAILSLIFYGNEGEAYNISDEKSDIRLLDLAKLICKIGNTHLVHEPPSTLESLGYSTATVARMDNTKLKSIGWNANFTLKSGLERTIEMISYSNKIS